MSLARESQRAWSSIRRPWEMLARIDQPAVGLALVVLLVWLSHVQLPGRTEEPGLDPAWQEVKAHELAHGWQAGVDTVFTYGPLGYFNPAPYHPALYWPKIVWWEIALRLVLTTILVTSVRGAGGAIEKTVSIAAFMFLANGPDAFTFAALVAITMRILYAARRRRTWMVAGFACMALLGLVKFTYFMAAGIGVACIVLERAFSVSWRGAARTAALYGLILVTVWALVGQSPLQLPRFVLTSWWIARGYNEAMTWIGPSREVSLAYVVVALVGIVAVLQVLQRPRDKAAWAAAIALCAVVFMALKAGFVRHGGNSITFFDGAAVSICLLPAMSPRGIRESALRGLQATARIACVLLGAYGGALSQRMTGAMPDFFVGGWAREIDEHTRNLSHLDRYRAQLEHRRRTVEAASALPRIRAAVKDEPIDAFANAQSWLLLNGLNYRPRPVFQSYSAYTPELIELNARFYSGERAPRFVLFEQDALDGRLPSSQDGLALQVLMRDYRPVLSEGGLILLERAEARARERPETRRLVHETTIRFDELLDLEAIYAADRESEAARTAGTPAARRRCYVVSMDIRPTLWGRIRSMLIKGVSPIAGCEFGWAAEFERGPSGEREIEPGADREPVGGPEPVYCRLVPGTMSTGALVSPFLDTLDAWTRWYTGEPVRYLARLRVSTHPEHRALFEPLIRVRVMRDDSLAPEIDPQSIARFTYPMFSPTPEYARASGRVTHARIQNLEVALMHAPAEMCFAVGPGQHTIRARFGFVPEAFERGCSDGAGFSIALRSGTGAETVLFHRVIGPESENPAGPHDVKLEVDAPPDARVLFRIGNGPSGQADCDWTYWTDVAITDGGPAPK